ncbi:hypothetical protein CPter91_1015 [Collimonas pratensis]|uniref:Uncharacterized protein n=1 Tax=Collimonas pratensis TaxID=279113 RepID=A0A127Q026_9BURK|nr:hypothetical protein CPter91_1015 [Collimonas pratensis]
MASISMIKDNGRFDENNKGNITVLPYFAYSTAMALLR